MGKTKSAKPWDEAFDVVRPWREPGKVYAPPPTRSDLDTVDLGVPLPASYRAFAMRFGLGGYFGLSPAFRLLHLDRLPRRVGKRAQREGTVVQDTSYLRKSAGASPPFRDQLEHCICFACKGTGVRTTSHAYIWDTREVTDRKWSEYPVFKLRLRVATRDVDSSLRIGNSFHEFVLWTAERWIRGKRRLPNPLLIPYHRPAVDRRHMPLQTKLSHWLAFNNNAVRDLARSIRDRGRVEDFPRLADALEAAGCTHEDLLDSCRHGDPDLDHVWVLRVLLGEG